LTSFSFYIPHAINERRLKNTRFGVRGMLDQYHGFEIRPLEGAGVRGVPYAPPDPREAELERLRLSLTRAVKRIDEFEERLKRINFRRVSIRNLMTTENAFANHVAACLKKRRFSDGEFRP
jgi:hypothetical protein